MLKLETVANVADNTGAKKVKVIRILKSSMAKSATVGDMLTVAVQSVGVPSSVKKGEIVQAMVVRVKKEIARKDGTYIRFGDNAVILLTKDAKGEFKPIGKRIFGPVAKELRELGHRNIVNMAEEVV